MKFLLKLVLAVLLLAILADHFGYEATYTDHMQPSFTLTRGYELYKEIAAEWSPFLKLVGTSLFLLLSAITLIWNLGLLAIRKAEVKVFGSFLARFIMFIATGYIILLYIPFIATWIINSFQYLGGLDTQFKTIDTTSFSFFINLMYNVLYAAPNSPSLFLICVALILAIAIVVLLTLVALNYLLTLSTSWFLIYIVNFVDGLRGGYINSKLATYNLLNILAVGTKLLFLHLAISATSLFIQNTIKANLLPLETIIIAFISCGILFVITSYLPSLVSRVVFGEHDDSLDALAAGPLLDNEAKDNTSKRYYSRKKSYMWKESYRAPLIIAGDSVVINNLENKPEEATNIK